jgi:tRNA/tmRNA/rRNA uracil-C5-methylase (TrmA/RlmC/RlmD family)
MARSAGRAIGVEIVEDAVDAARKNAALNGLDNCEFIAGDVLKVMPAIKSGELLGCDAADDGVMTGNDSGDADASEKPAGVVPVAPDVIVVDPPRAGIHPKVLPMIAEYGVDEILYISCNPKTMCKDLAVLQEHGYSAEYMKPYDNFPMTKHVECVVLLAKV